MCRLFSSYLSVCLLPPPVTVMDLRTVMIISTLLLMAAGKCTLSLGHVQQNIEEQESQPNKVVFYESSIRPLRYWDIPRSELKSLQY